MSTCMTLALHLMIRSLLKFSMLILVLVGSFYLTKLFIQSDSKAVEDIEIETSINIEKDLHDFGNVSYLKPVNTYFHFRNTGNRNFIITKIISSCGCTVPKWNKNAVPPDTRDSILVEFAADQKGAFHRNIHVYSNAADSPHVFYIQGQVN